MDSGYHFPIDQSNLLKYRELELREIEKLKWAESEKAGYDIGWQRAEWLWLTTHGSKWRMAMRASGAF